MKVLCSTVLIFMSSSLSTNPSVCRDRKNMDVDMLPEQPNEKHTEHTGKTEALSVFLFKIFNESRKLFKQQIVTEKKECSFNEFLRNIFTSLIQEWKISHQETNITLNEFEQNVLDELMSELKLRYNNIAKQEKENSNSDQIIAKNIIDKKWSMIESRFRDSNKFERKMIFATLIDMYLLENINEANAVINLHNEIKFLKLKISQIISRFRKHYFNLVMYETSPDFQNDYMVVVTGIIQEIKRMNAEEKQAALNKYVE